MSSTTLPPTRILSWLSQIEEADPDYTYKATHYWQYEFSNGRLFYNQPTSYSKRDWRENSPDWY